MRAPRRVESSAKARTRRRVTATRYVTEKWVHPSQGPSVRVPVSSVAIAESPVDTARIFRTSESTSDGSESRTSHAHTDSHLHTECHPHVGHVETLTDSSQAHTDSHTDSHDHIDSHAHVPPHSLTDLRGSHIEGRSQLEGRTQLDARPSLKGTTLLVAVPVKNQVDQKSGGKFRGDEPLSDVRSADANFLHRIRSSIALGAGPKPLQDALRTAQEGFRSGQDGSRLTQEGFRSGRETLRKEPFVTIQESSASRWGTASRETSRQRTTTLDSWPLEAPSPSLKLSVLNYADTPTLTANDAVPKQTVILTKYKQSVPNFRSPQSLHRQSRKVLGKLLEDFSSGVLVTRPLSANLLRDKTESDLINMSLNLATCRLPEAELLTTIANSYHQLVLQIEVRSSNSSKPRLLENGAGKAPGETLDRLGELCLRAAAMLRSCDYPLDEILCLFGVAASQLDTVFARLQVADPLERIYIALLQVRAFSCACLFPAHTYARSLLPRVCE